MVSSTSHAGFKNAYSVLVFVRGLFRAPAYLAFEIKSKYLRNRHLTKQVLKAKEDLTRGTNGHYNKGGTGSTTNSTDSG